MMIRLLRILRNCFPLLLVLMILGNCAPQRTLGPAYLIGPETRSIEIELRSFSFELNHIAILNNSSPFTFLLKNTAQIKHNFTLIDSYKNILMNIDVMPNESTTATIKSRDSGNYTFYCNRFLHRFSGMEGMLMVD